MKKSIFAICDLDASYACNLTDYLNDKKAAPFEIQAFTNVDALESFAKDHEIEILLISTKAMCDPVKELSVKKTIILSEGERLQGLDDYPVVYKYQSSDRLLAEVLEYYSEVHPKPRMMTLKSQKTKVYGIYSPIGRTGKTSFALAMGTLLASHQSVLYLNLETYSGLGELVGTDFRANLPDLVYYSKRTDGNLLYKMNAMIQTLGELQYVPPSVSPSDLRDISGTEWVDFLRELISYSEYDTVILDLSDQVDEVFRVLDICRLIFMPVLDDPVSQAKVHQFEKLMHMRSEDELLKKTEKLYLPVQQQYSGGGEWIDQILHGEISEYTKVILKEAGIWNG